MNSRVFIKLCAAVMITAVAIILGLQFVKSKPKAKREKPASITPAVTVQPLAVKNHQAIVEVMGTVIPAKKVTVRSRVTGEIVTLHPDFLEGGFLQKGETIARLDDVDYKLIKQQREATLAQCASDLTLEEGQQDIARREWELLGAREATDRDRELALRVPQLRSKQAVYKSAKAALKKAEVDLARTSITTPFNAVILSADVQLGDQVNSQTQLAALVGTDAFHIQVSLPISKLSWIKIPSNRNEQGAPAVVIAQGGRRYSGKVVKLLSDIEPGGRMARLLVEVKDPLKLKDGRQGRLLLGEYVTVKIEGQQLQNVIPVPRTAFHNNSEIWIITGDNKLKVIKTKPVWEERSTVFIKNRFLPDEKLITSELSFPVEGMSLNIFSGKKGK